MASETVFGMPKSSRFWASSNVLPVVSTRVAAACRRLYLSMSCGVLTMNVSPLKFPSYSCRTVRYSSYAAACSLYRACVSQGITTRPATTSFTALATRELRG